MNEYASRIDSEVLPFVVEVSSFIPDPLMNLLKSVLPKVVSALVALFPIPLAFNVSRMSSVPYSEME